MATDATGTPTSLGIPKYDPDNDAPSGLGFNAAMDAIDTLIAANPNKPAGIVSGEAVIYNGTSWVRSTTTPLGLSSIAQGGATTGQALTWSGSAWAPSTISSTITVGTSLPGSPSNGDKYIYTDSTTAPTYHWLLQYDSSISGTYKWRFLGGTELRNENTSTQSSSTSLDLVTITLPLAGIWDVYVAGRVTVLNASGRGEIAISTTTLGSVTISGSSTSGPWLDQRRVTEASASATAAVRGITGGSGNSSWNNNKVWAFPVQVI